MPPRAKKKRGEASTSATVDPEATPEAAAPSSAPAVALAAQSTNVQHSLKNETAKKDFNKWTVQNKPIIMEVAFQPTQGAHGNLFEMMTSRNWLSNLCQAQYAGNPSVVREFYANVHAHILEHGDAPTSVQVRKKKVTFTAAAINKHYGLPDIRNDEYSALLESDVDYNNILSQLSPPGAQWARSPHTELPLTIPHSYLNVVAKMVNLFICGNLMPALNKTIVPKERVLLLYAICKGLTIDVGRLIRSSILDIASGFRLFSWIYR